MRIFSLQGLANVFIYLSLVPIGYYIYLITFSRASASIIGDPFIPAAIAFCVLVASIIAKLMASKNQAAATVGKYTLGGGVLIAGIVGIVLLVGIIAWLIAVFRGNSSTIPHGFGNF